MWAFEARTHAHVPTSATPLGDPVLDGPSGDESSSEEKGRGPPPFRQEEAASP